MSRLFTLNLPGNSVPEIEVVSGLADVNDTNKVLYVKVNESASFVINAEDEGDVSYQFIENTANANISQPDAISKNVRVEVLLNDGSRQNLR